MCEEQKCQEDVFPLAVNYLDRFLSKNPIQKNHLQLLGTTCLLVSTKLRECESLTVDMLILYTDNTVTSEELFVSTPRMISFSLYYYYINRIPSSVFVAYWQVFSEFFVSWASRYQPHPHPDFEIDCQFDGLRFLNFKFYYYPCLDIFFFKYNILLDRDKHIRE